MPRRTASRLRRSGLRGGRVLPSGSRAAGRTHLAIVRERLAQRIADVRRVFAVVDRAIRINEPEIRLSSLVGGGVPLDDVLEVDDRGVERLATQVVHTRIVVLGREP